MSGSSQRAEHDGRDTSSTSPGPSSSALVALVAPVIALGVTALSRRALTSAYRSITGTDAPSTKDRGTSLSSVIAWAAVTGATAAVIEAVIFRATARAFDRL